MFLLLPTSYHVHVQLLVGSGFLATCKGPMVARFLLRVMIPIAPAGCSWHSSCPGLREVLPLLSHPGRGIFPHGGTHREHILNPSTEIRLVQFLLNLSPSSGGCLSCTCALPGLFKCNRKGDLGVFWRKKKDKKTSLKTTTDLLLHSGQYNA